MNLNNYFLLNISQMDIHKLNLKRDKRELGKIQLYKKVLGTIYNKIERTSKKCETSIFYRIPEFIFGIPRYDIVETSKFIVSKLQQQGYVVVYTPPNFIFVSWDHIPSELQLEYEPAIVNTEKSVIIKQPYKNINLFNSSNSFLSKLD